MQKNEKILYLQGEKERQRIDYKIITIFLKRIKLIKNTKSFLKDKKYYFNFIIFFKHILYTYFSLKYFKYEVKFLVFFPLRFIYPPK